MSVYHQPRALKDICPFCGAYGELLDEHDSETDERIRTICPNCLREER